MSFGALPPASICGNGGPGLNGRGSRREGARRLGFLPSVMGRSVGATRALVSALNPRPPLCRGWGPDEGQRLSREGNSDAVHAPGLSLHHGHALLLIFGRHFWLLRVMKSLTVVMTARERRSRVKKLDL